MAVTDYNLSGD